MQNLSKSFEDHSLRSRAQVSHLECALSVESGPHPAARDAKTVKKTANTTDRG